MSYLSYVKISGEDCHYPKLLLGLLERTTFFPIELYYSLLTGFPIGSNHACIRPISSIKHFQIVGNAANRFSLSHTCSINLRWSLVASQRHYDRRLSPASDSYDQPTTFMCAVLSVRHMYSLHRVYGCSIVLLIVFVQLFLLRFYLTFIVE